MLRRTAGMEDTPAIARSPHPLDEVTTAKLTSDSPAPARHRAKAALLRRLETQSASSATGEAQPPSPQRLEIMQRSEAPAEAVIQAADLHDLSILNAMVARQRQWAEATAVRERERDPCS